MKWVNVDLIKVDTSSVAIERTKNKFSWIKDLYIEPPYSFRDLIKIYEINTYANKSIELIAKNATLHWYSVVADWEVRDEDLERVKDFFENCNPEKTFEEIIYDVIIDLYTTWNAAIEVVRNPITWEVQELYHIPIDTIRVARWDWKNFRTWQRFIQVIDEIWEEYIWYNRYLPRAEDRTKDNWYDPDLNEKMWLPTNEVIWLKLPNPWNLWYWLSPSITLLKSYLIRKYIEEFNISEFESWFLNKFAIVVQWAPLTKESIETLKHYLEDLRRDRKWNAIPVIHTSQWEVKIQKIWDSIREWSYLELLDKVDKEVIVAFGVPPIMLWIVEDANRANSIEQEKKFYEKEIVPLQKKICKIFTTMIREDFWINAKLVANSPDFRDLTNISEVINKLIDKWVISINEARQMMWLDILVDEKWEPLAGAEENFVRLWQMLISVKELSEEETKQKEALLWKVDNEIQKISELLNRAKDLAEKEAEKEALL